jgi:hypothetical protein
LFYLKTFLLGFAEDGLTFSGNPLRLGNLYREYLSFMFCMFLKQILEPWIYPSPYPIIIFPYLGP